MSATPVLHLFISALLRLPSSSFPPPHPPLLPPASHQLSGRRWFDEFLSALFPQPLLPLLGGRGNPSPYPSPGSERAAPRPIGVSKMAQGGSKRVPGSPRWPPRWLKVASDILRRGHQTAPRRSQVPSEPSKDLPKRPRWLQILKGIYVFCLLVFSLPMGLGGFRMAPKRPERAPRGAQDL